MLLLKLFEFGGVETVSNSVFKKSMITNLDDLGETFSRPITHVKYY